MPGGRRRLLTALVAAAAMVVTPLALASTPVNAVPIDTGWTVEAGGAGVTTQNDGSTSAASFSYNLQNAGVGVARSWDFTTVATQATSPADPIRIPWTWQGLHAWFGVHATLQPIVNDVPVTLPETVGGYLVNPAPQNCCLTPSNGFLYSFTATFENLQPGDRYGFRLVGQNSDSNNFLTGTFTLSTRPYIDATLGAPGDNRQWFGAKELTTAGLGDKILEPGEARWYKFQVFPGQEATVDLTQLSRDYDLALYGDIGQAFEQLSNSQDLTEVAASASGAVGTGAQVASLPAEVSKIATSPSTLPSTQFAPRVYAPRVYAPRVYAPRVYAPRVYAPRVYAPRVYAPGSYTPDLTANQAFRDAFSAAQDQTLLVASSNTDLADEKVSALTGNTLGEYYVRVQGHDDQVFDATQPYRLDLAFGGSVECDGVTDIDASTVPAVSGIKTLILTDTNALGLGADDPDRTAYLNALNALAAEQDGAVVDVYASERVRLLKDQVVDNARCPYATNLVAEAIKDIVDGDRGSGTLKYVVIAGGDEVIPFFRYPDLAGFGEEKQYSPPMLGDTPSGASLNENMVLSQDAYGSRTSVTISGITMPVPDLAVGRLVKTPDEIVSTVEHFLGLDGGNLPIAGNGRSLVTGYDFLADAAKRVNAQFSAALPDGEHNTLIEEPGVPLADSWDADDLRAKMFNGHHELVYLAGHFSAQDTEAANFVSAVEASELAATPNAGLFEDTLVLSAGCHSGYSIVPTEAGSGVVTADWSQQLARQHALLIGGTGYQYGDSDFLEYSERLYLGIARRLREGTGAADPAVAVGNALVLAKQDYLASLATLQGIDQKAVLQATLYGLPMTGFDAPGRAPLDTDASVATPSKVLDGGAGEAIGLYVDDIGVTTPLDQTNTPVGQRHSKPLKPEEQRVGLPTELTWREGRDGVAVEPGLPALPKQVVDVTPVGAGLPDLLLRGVGFRGGSYQDSGPLLPLTGAPAIEGATANTTFFSPTFWPQKLATPNYFGALGDSGRTSLILTPAQYRNAPGADPEQPTNTERAYSHLDFRLFYSSPQSETFGGENGNQPALAAAPAISDVQGVLGTDNRIHFRVRVTGDPSAGVQQAWVAFTTGPDANGNGSWEPQDLTQDPLDSTVWVGESRVLTNPVRANLRFVPQAANGAGAVGIDTAEGDGYEVAPPGVVDNTRIALSSTAPGTGSPLGVTASVTTPGGSPVAGRKVAFSVIQDGAALFGYEGLTGADGKLALDVPAGTDLPVGRFTVIAYIFDAQNFVLRSATIEVDTAKLAVATDVAGTPLGVVATVTDVGGQPWADRTVRWSVMRNGVELYSGDGQTGSDGTVAVQGMDGKIPGGPLTVRVDLVGLSGSVVGTQTVSIFVNALRIRPDTTFLTALPTKTFGAGIKVTLVDDFGDVKVSGLQVTYTIPAVAGKFGNSQVSTRTTDTNGSTTSATPTAGSTIGIFEVTVSTIGAPDLKVPVAVKYDLGAFGSPVNNKAGAVNGGSGNLPLKWTVLGADNKAISDADAAGLVTDQRIQLRYRLRGTTDWTARTDLAYYDPLKGTFIIDLKTTDLGMTKPNVYEVEVRVLPTAPLPVGYAADDSEFDLGRSIRLLVKAEK